VIYYFPFHNHQYALDSRRTNEKLLGKTFLRHTIIQSWISDNHAVERTKRTNNNKCCNSNNPYISGITRATSSAAMLSSPVVANFDKGNTCIKASLTKRYKTMEIPTPAISDMGTFLFGLLISPQRVLPFFAKTSKE
jgi:hypothetical protein